MTTSNSSRPLAIVTGASSGIGYELARLCATHGFDLLIAADQPEVQNAAREFEKLGAVVTAVETDLATPEGVDRLVAKIAGRPVAALLANAGHGLGKGFLDQEFTAVRHVVDTNITGTIYLIQVVGLLAAGVVAVPIFRRLGSISRPMMKRNITTPNCAASRMVRGSLTSFNPNGPIASPAAR